MLDKKPDDKIYPWFRVSMQYLIATQFLLDIICENRNKHSYFGDVIDESSLEKKIESNDGEIFYPLMFIFYHSLEVIFKALIKSKTNAVSKGHSITKLYRELSELGFDEEDLHLLGNYVVDIDSKLPEFEKWLKSTGLGIDGFYESLKYPANDLNKGKKDAKELFLNGRLIGREEDTLYFYNNLRADIVAIRRLIVRYYNSNFAN